ncbi:MAG: hypothetical protein N4A65_13855 [Cohaesibacter sp.]|jgi:hypothetical protein|nr:hypothetical protein [Cohaesibacter sp.]
MSKEKQEQKAQSGETVTVRDHLNSATRMRKAVIGSILLVVALGLLLGPRWEGDSNWLLVLAMAVAFISLGLAYAGLSQSIMGWSRETEIDFAKAEVHQRTASLFGRSRPFTLPFLKIADMTTVEMGGGEPAAQPAIMLELKDSNGRAMMKLAQFSSAQEADDIAKRIKERLQQGEPDHI